MAVHTIPNSTVAIIPDMGRRRTPLVRTTNLRILRALRRCSALANSQSASRLRYARVPIVIPVLIGVHLRSSVAKLLSLPPRLVALSRAGYLHGARAVVAPARIARARIALQVRARSVFAAGRGTPRCVLRIAATTPRVRGRIGPRFRTITLAALVVAAAARFTATFLRTIAPARGLNPLCRIWRRSDGPGVGRLDSAGHENNEKSRTFHDHVSPKQSRKESTLRGSRRMISGIVTPFDENGRKV